MSFLPPPWYFSRLLSLISNVGQHGGAEKWRIRRNMEKSEKWAGRRPWGREVENSKKFGEIGEMGWPTMGVRKGRIRGNMEKSGQ